MGLPIIATPVGGLPEIIDGNGLFIPVLHPEDAAQAIHRLSSDVEVRQQMSINGVVLARAYDVNNMVRVYETQLEQAMCSPAEVPPLAQG